MLNDARNIKDDLRIKLEANLEFSHQMQALLEKLEDENDILDLYEDWTMFLRHLITMVETAEKVRQVNHEYYHADSEITRLLKNYS